MATKGFTCPTKIKEDAQKINTVKIMITYMAQQTLCSNCCSSCEDTGILGNTLGTSDPYDTRFPALLNPCVTNLTRNKCNEFRQHSYYLLNNQQNCNIHCQKYNLKGSIQIANLGHSLTFVSPNCKFSFHNNYSTVQQISK